MWGPHGTRVITSDSYWNEPLKWNAAAEKAGKRHRIFCASLADVFEDWNGPLHNHKKEILMWADPNDIRSRPATMADVRNRLFSLIDNTPYCDWLLLTKRPENVREMWSVGHHLSNVWLGTSISEQETADRNLPILLGLRDLCPVLWASYEPTLGPAVLKKYLTCEFCNGAGTITEDHDNGAVETLTCPCCHGEPLIQWVVVGGESGAKARPYDPVWAEYTLKECREAGVAAFHKQFGSNVRTGVFQCQNCGHIGLETDFEPDDVGTLGCPKCDRAHLMPVDPGAMTKRDDPDKWPERFRVQQWPSYLVPTSEQ